jgi:hypothetical protein
MARDEFNDDDRPVRRRPRDEYDDPRDHYPDDRRRQATRGINIPGLVGMILGILGLILSAVGCTLFIGMPIAAIALLLGIIGLFVGRETTGRGFPIAAVCISLAGLLAGGIWIAVGASVIKKADEKMEQLKTENEARMKAMEEEARVAREHQAKAEKELREGPALTVAAEKLYQDYETNALSADTKYKDKVVEVTGEILKVNKDRFNRLTVDLDAGGDGMIRCDFPRGTENQLEKLKAPQKVTIRGRCKGRDRKDLIVLDDCLLVSRK